MITNTNSIGSAPTPSNDPVRARGPRPSAPAATREDSLSTVNTANLEAALAGTPAIRAEVVQRAASLAVDPAYPPLAIIEKIARMIAESNDPSAE
jgi:hypothetical protein